jgi:hypothetical protein
MLKILILLTIITAIFSCSVQNPVSANEEAGNENRDLQITSFTGEKITDPDNPTEFLYIQNVKWSSKLPEAKFAFRITTSDLVLPSGIQTDEEGWIYQTQTGINSDSGQTIWTDKNEFEISFSSIFGEFPRIVTDFEIKYLYENTESEPVHRNFLADRDIGSIISTTGGNIDGQVCGTAVHFKVTEQILDIFVEGLYAHHFMYRLNIIAESDSSMISEGVWFNSINCENIRDIYLTSFSQPALIPNNENEMTQFEAYVVTRNDYSDEDNANSVNFKVQEGFYPETIIYNGYDYLQDWVDGEYCDTWVLGGNHYTLINHPTPRVIPYTISEDVIHYSTPFFVNSEGDFAALNSADLKVYSHFGWHGEYGRRHQGGIFTVTDDPFDERISVVVNEGNIMYFSEIAYFDIRLDNAPFINPLYPADEYNITDDDGTQWLRIPANDENAQFPVLEDLDSGEHTLEVRVVDSQLAVDLSPSVFSFVLTERVPAEDKSGILILDDDHHHSMFAPDDEIDYFYLNILNNYSDEITVLDREELQYEVAVPFLHFGMDIFSPTDLEPYKIIIYHSDYVIFSSSIQFEYDVLHLYFENDGNIIFSGGRNIENSFIQSDYYDIHLYSEFFGINSNPETAVEILSGSFNQNAFFNKASAEYNDFNDVDLQLPSFNTLVSNYEGLGPIVFFDEFDADCDILYSSGIKYPEEGTNFEEWDDQDDNDAYPSENQYNLFNGRNIALKKVHENNKCYIFGFPLSYMEVDDVRQMMNQIISEIEE